MPWEIEQLALDDQAGWWFARMQQVWRVQAEVEQAERDQRARGHTGGEGWQHGT